MSQLNNKVWIIFVGKELRENVEVSEKNVSRINNVLQLFI